MILSAEGTKNHKQYSIESKVCSALGKTDLLYISSNDIKSCNKISKRSLGEDILSITKLITDVCMSNNVKLIKSCINNTSELQELTSSVKDDLKKLFHDQNSITNIEKSLTINSESLTSIKSEINNLKSYVQSLNTSPVTINHNVTPYDTPVDSESQNEQFYVTLLNTLKSTQKTSLMKHLN